MIKKWIDMRMKERTSWDGAALIVLGLMVLFLAPIAKIEYATFPINNFLVRFSAIIFVAMYCPIEVAPPAIIINGRRFEYFK